MNEVGVYGADLVPFDKRTAFVMSSDDARQDRPADAYEQRSRICPTNTDADSGNAGTARPLQDAAWVVSQRMV